MLRYTDTKLFCDSRFVELRLTSCWLDNDSLDRGDVKSQTSNEAKDYWRSIEIGKQLALV